MLRCNSKRVWRRSSWQKLNGNPDQKTILLEQAYDELKTICTKFQDQSGATNIATPIPITVVGWLFQKLVKNSIYWEV